MIRKYNVKKPERPEPVRWDWKRCECKKTIVVKTIMSNGKPQVKRVCTRCGNQVGNNIPLSSVKIDSIPVRDETLQERYHQNMQADIAAENERRNQEYSEKWWSWYGEYLKSPIWRERSSAVIERAGGVCEACGKNRATQAHHKTYEHVGGEPLFELVAVCEECHRQITDKTI